MMTMADFRVAFPTPPEVVGVLAVLSTPHLLYLFIWTNPTTFTKFSKMFKMQAVELFSHVGSAPSR
jgi:hypothetical protein